MKTTLTFCFVLISCAATLAQETCNNFWATISPDGNYIYFSSDRHGGDYEIYKVDIDGTSNLQQLTSSGGMKLYPAVSPDGSLVAFQHGAYDASAEIYIMNNDGSNLTRLTNNDTYDGYPNFSPDGNTLVFDGWDESPYPEIFTMNIDGSGRTQITNEPGAYWQSAPVYNPSGTKIYFSEGFNADNYYIMMDLDGSNWVNITEPNVFGDSDGGLRFNADGSKILFFTTDYVGYNNGCDLIIANADGSNREKITSSIGGEYFYGGAFHPSNGKLYFSYYPGAGGKYSINTMNQDGTGDEKISNCNPLGVSENTLSKKLLIYPNPSQGMLNINYPDNFTLELYDIIGRPVVTSTTRQTDIRHLQPGIYTALLKDQEARLLHTEKVIKH